MAPPCHYHLPIPSVNDDILSCANLHTLSALGTQRGAPAAWVPSLICLGEFPVAAPEQPAGPHIIPARTNAQRDTVTDSALSSQNYWAFGK